jgi:copper chaperone CopZ
MRWFLPCLVVSLLPPASAQFREIDIRFEGIGCASCLESLPGRLKRMRGVESVKVDAQRSIVELRLAAENRVRLEQVRDAIEQDGTKAMSARVVVQGIVEREGDIWILRPGGVPGVYALDGSDWKPGPATVEAAAGLHPADGRLRLTPRR